MRLFSSGNLNGGPRFTPNENMQSWVEIEDFNSLSWSERSHDYGDFKLQIVSDTIEPQFGTYSMWMRDDSDFVMICEDIHAHQLPSGKYLQEYSGRSLESMLEWRINEDKIPLQIPDSRWLETQLYLETILHNNFGSGASARRRIPGFNVHRELDVNSWIRVNMADFDSDWDETVGLTLDRDHIVKHVRRFLDMTKPNGFSMFYRIRMRNSGFWVDFEAPFLVEPLVLSPSDDDFTNFEYVWSNRKKYSNIIEVYEHYEVDPKKPQNGKSRTNVLEVRNEIPMLRREVLWNNTADHKVLDPNDKDSKKDSRDVHKKNAYDYSNPYYPIYVAADKAGEYTPVMQYSAKLDSFGANIKYRQDLFVGDVVRYIPDPGINLRQQMRMPDGTINWEKYAEQRRIDLQLTEVTESWDSSGYTLQPSFTGYAEKWTGEGSRVSIERNSESVYRAIRSR